MIRRTTKAQPQPVVPATNADLQTAVLVHQIDGAVARIDAVLGEYARRHTAGAPTTTTGPTPTRPGPPAREGTGRG